MNDDDYCVYADYDCCYWGMMMDSLCDLTGMKRKTRTSMMEWSTFAGQTETDCRGDGVAVGVHQRSMNRWNEQQSQSGMGLEGNRERERRNGKQSIRRRIRRHTMPNTHTQSQSVSPIYQHVHSLPSSISLLCLSFLEIQLGFLLY